MALSEEWGTTGKELGGAFKSFGKSLVKSAKTGIDMLEKDDEDKERGGAGSEAVSGSEETKESNVFNDGTWRETGKSLGGAFASLGKSIYHSAEEGINKADEAFNSDDEKKE